MRLAQAARSSRWTPVVLLALGLTLAIIGIRVAPQLGARDFQPFVMTIESWNGARQGTSVGTAVGGTETYRLEYQSRTDWTMTLVSDDLQLLAPGQGSRCRNGMYQTFDPRGQLTVGPKDARCDGVGRWIHFRIAESLPWPRESADGRVTYTSNGERITFDLSTGLPVLYESGPPGGSVGERMIFRLDRYGL